MKRYLVGLALLAAWSLSSAAEARSVTDCPLRNVPYSTTSPLIDILLNDRARAVASKALSQINSRLPPGFLGTSPPTLAAVLTLKNAPAILHLPGLDTGVLDRELARIPLTTTDKVARCARYDNDVPRIRMPEGSTRILLFEKINGFKDTPSVNAAHAAFVELARENGWALVTTEKGGAFNRSTLRQFDVVIWNNVSGDVLTLTQRRVFRDWIENGGAFVGLHGSAGDPVYFWDWYADRLIGARFAGHPLNPQFQTARILIDEPVHPIAHGLPLEWLMNEEWYSFGSNPRQAGAHVVATVDERSYKPEALGQSLRMGADHPIAWTNCIGRGAMFYSAIGHLPEVYSAPQYRTMLRNAVNWTARSGSCSRSH